MSRTVSITSPITSLRAALAALCALALLSGTARAGAYTYSAGTGTQRTVNAGVLLLDGNISGGQNADPTGQGADNKDPYVFYILNQRIDVKPFGWNIVNPLAPPSVVSTVYQRWLNRTPAADAPTYQLGQTLTPAMAAYWEVPLAATASSDLSKFDILFLNLEKSPAFTAADSEKLRRFVDGGGTLWIENSGTAVTTSVPGLFFNLTFNNGTTGSAYLPTLIHAPLITVPYQLSEQELNTLGDKHIGGYYANDGVGTNAPQDASGRLRFSTIVGNSGNNDLPVIAEAPYGAGEIVITTTGSANAISEYAGGVDVGVGGNSGPFCGINTQIAPTADLKLVSDIIASTGSHYNEHQNSHQSGNDTDSLPSAVQTWNFPNKSTATIPTGAVISGHIAFAVVGSQLTAFDLYPGEDLDGDGNPDDGNIPDYNTGTPYDEIWAQTLKPLTSAPTVATDTYPVKVNGVTTNVTGPAVFVELPSGVVQEYSADTTGQVIATYQDSKSHGIYTNQAAPAPTIFDGRVYAGQEDGTLYVVPLQSVGGAGNAYAVDPAVAAGNATATEVAVAPTVGIIPNTNSGTIPNNDIVALCVTQRGLFSVFLGSRGELLNEIGTTGDYNTKLLTLTNSVMDVGGVLRTYTLNTDNMAVLNGATPDPTGMAPFFTGGPTTGQLYGDYDVNFALTPVTANITRTFAGATTQIALNTSGSYAGASISTPALDRLGNAYYTVTDANGSSIVSLHDGPNLNSVHINWRFLLPKTGVSPGLDADGTNYDSLEAYTFTTTANGVTVPSAPIVDVSGNVYVLATKAGSGTASGTTALLSFNTQATISADAVDATGQAGGISSVSITQPVTGGTVDEFGGDPVTLSAAQYSLSTTGHIDFIDFGQHGGLTSGAANLYPDLNEPFPITVGFSTGGAATTQNQNVRPLHTNLAWYTVFDGSASTVPSVARPTVTASSGITLVGGTLYFIDGNGFLTSVPADPSGAGFTVTHKFVESATAAGATPLATSIDNANVGTTTAVPSASNGALLVNGPLGLTAYSNQVTLVVDANRVLEMNASGDAQWAVDSTTKTTLAGGTTPIYNNGSSSAANAGTGQYVTTTLELNRPTSLTELTANDYLVADTGNNRCVRFDRGGQVLWELTKFTDPFGKLKPGEPDTLNQPTSVQIRSDSRDANGNPLLDAKGNPETIVRYLISDTGNDRIVEVDDVFDQNFNYELDPATNLPEYHVLNWISHTHDVQGRDYRYQSAAYYASPNGKYYVVALITNKRLATFTAPTPAAGQYGAAAPNLLGPANQDVAGGTIVLLDYDPTNYYGTTTGTFGANNQADGFIATTATTSGPAGLKPIAISTIQASLTNGGNFDPTGASIQRTLYIRNPRYLKVVTKLQTSSDGGTPTSIRHYLLADDNGVWDLNGNTFIAQFGYTQADYQAMTTPISQDGVTGVSLQSGTQQIPFLRSATPNVPYGIPFVPTAIQLTGSDLVGSTTYGRYLITNSYSQGEAVNNTGNFGNAYAPTGSTLPTTAPTTIPGFGGEVFEVHYLSNTSSYVETHDTQSGTPRYSGHTTSRPSGTNTSPLSQPAFAYRLQF